MIVNMRIYLDFSRKLFTLSVVIYQTAITCEVTGHQQTKIVGGPSHLPWPGQIAKSQKSFLDLFKPIWMGPLDVICLHFLGMPKIRAMSKMSDAPTPPNGGKWELT